MNNSNGPRCPNHDVPLSECRDGIGTCPISGYRFAYTADENNDKQELKIDLSGNLVAESGYFLTSLDGDGG